jgi:S1-C subfamily serine protease
VARFLEVEQSSAARVSDVQPGSPAAAGGVRADDLVIGIDGMPVRSVDDLLRLLDESRIGKQCVVRLLRGAKPHYATVVPVESLSR